MTSSALNSVTNLAAVQRNLRAANDGIVDIKNTLNGEESGSTSIKTLVENNYNMGMLKRPYYKHTVSKNMTSSVLSTQLKIKERTTTEDKEKEIKQNIYFNKKQIIVSSTSVKSITTADSTNTTTLASIYSIGYTKTGESTFIDLSKEYNVYLLQVGNTSSTKYYLIEADDLTNSEYIDFYSIHVLGIVPNTNYAREYTSNSSGNPTCYGYFDGCVGYTDDSYGYPIFPTPTDADIDNSTFFTLENHPEFQIMIAPTA